MKTATKRGERKKERKKQDKLKHRGIVTSLNVDNQCGM